MRLALTLIAVEVKTEDMEIDVAEGATNKANYYL
jgi:hypothetical protein